MYIYNRVCYILSMVIFVCSFNLDTEYAHIIEGDKNSNFGFSVALWQDSNNKKWVVVGAPTAQRTLDVSTPRPGSIGDLVTCDMNQKCDTISSLPMIKSSVDWKGVDYALQEKLPSIGLGETISVASSSSGPLMVCSPRYIRLIEVISQNITTLTTRGMCYLLNTRESTPILIDPFPEQSVVWDKSLYTTPSANAGMGAYLSQNDLAVVGIPTMFYYSGGVCSSNLRGKRGGFTYSKTVPTSMFDSDYEGWAIVGAKFNGVHEYFAVSLPGQPILYGKVIFYTQSLKRIPAFRIIGKEFGARFGDSLAAGDFDGDGADDLVVSAHLSNVQSVGLNKMNVEMADAGKVYVYYAPVLARGSAKTNTVLSGMSPKAYFGYSILSPGDLNGDGYQDLVVGAPYDESGKVFIYNGSPEGLIATPKQTLVHNDFLRTGNKIQDGFGFSLGGGLDIDDNGHPDIVIGSLSSDSAVLVRSAPVMKLQMKASFDTGVVALGKEKCPITLLDGSKVNATCFQLKVQVQYISQKFRQRIAVSISIELDTKRTESRILFKNNNRRIHSIRKIASTSEEPKPFDIWVYVKPMKSTQFTSLKEPIYTNVAVDLLPRSQMMASLGVKGDLTTSFDTPAILPVLDPFSVHEIETSVRFVCEEQDECFTKPDLILEVLGNQNFTIGMKEILLVNITLTVKDDPAFQIQLEGDLPPNFSFLRVLRGKGYSSAENNEVWCLIKVEENSISDVPVRTLSCHIADYLPVGKKIRFTMLFDHSPLEITSQVQINGPGSSFIFNFKAYSDTTDKNSDDNSATWKTTPILRSDALLLSTTIPDGVKIWTNDTEALEKVKNIMSTDSHSSSKSHNSPKLEFTDYIGANITHKYTIINVGPSPIVDAQVTISWPTHVRGFPLLLFWKELLTSGPVQCEPLDNDVTIQQFIDSSSNTSRDAYESDALTREKRSSNSDPRYNGTDLKDLNLYLNENKKSTTISLDCNMLQCYKIRCKVGPLLLREKINIDVSVITVATLFNMINHQRFLLTSKIEMESELLNFKNSSQTSTLINFGKLSELSAVDMILMQWWILLIAIIAGLLIILLISGILYKFGFFKRKRVQRGAMRGSNHPQEAVFVSANTMSQVHPLRRTPILEHKDYINDTSESQDTSGKN